MTNFDMICKFSIEQMAEFLLKWDEEWEEWIASDGTKFNENEYDKAMAHEITWLKKESVIAIA